MTQFRKNHNKSQKTGSTLMRMVGFIIFFVGTMFYIYYALKNDEFTTFNSNDHSPNTGSNIVISPDEIVENQIEKDFLPLSTTGQVVDHNYFTLSYHEEFEQSEWVAYLLTRGSIQAPNVPRTDRFEPDYAISTRSAFHRDYTGSGYTRGHLAPAGDMAFSEDAMRKSFLMSNMSPQIKAFNNGIWRELEELVRDWAYKNKEVYVVTGPVLRKDDIVKRIGQNKVAVPRYFYKIILDYAAPDMKGIAFIMPNEISLAPVMDYAVSIDSVEALTGIDFFADFLSSEEELSLEAKFNTVKWPVNQEKYEARIKHWNNN